MQRSLTTELFARASAEPDRLFCIHYFQKESEIITYGELYHHAQIVASNLAARGCGPDDVALLFLKHEPNMYATFVGCMLAGVAPSFMPYPNPKQDSGLFWKSHRELLERVLPRLIIVSPSLRNQFVENLPEFEDRIYITDQLLSEANPLLDLHLAHDPAFLQHSSGTTATKKGVMLSHAQVLAQVASYQRAIGLNEEDVIASWLPLYHDMGLIACFILTLTTGATLIALDPFDWVVNPSSLLEAIETHRATFSWLPNFAFNHIATSTRPGRRYDLSSIRALVNCSEPCKPRSFDVFFERFAECGLSREQLHVCYAMAENVFAVTQTDVNETMGIIGVERDELEINNRIVAGETLRLLSCGRPIAGVEIRIVDEGGATLQEGNLGEIAISSPFLFSGYYRMLEKTARVLREGWYYTGDLGFLQSGELFVTGRRDDLLIAYGRNYYAHDIEGVVNSLEGLIPGRCVAFAAPSEVAGTNQIVLVAETKTPSDHALARQIRESVFAASGLALSDVFLREPGWLIKTTSGKIARGANLARYLESKTVRT
jgi:fatty-acyl-CoA synthase